eukprot:m.479156 g.479156  ORF g.479156 m.479156 type:complete len:475 (-) comp21344_c0_seq1:90-1514(-)
MASSTVVKEGWLLKQGEFIRTWRPRFFQLKSDGSFRGYKMKPTADSAQDPEGGPINVFEIGNSTIVPVDPKKGDKKGKHGFTVRFMQLTRVIERTFHCESAEERDTWVQAYKQVQQDVNSKLTVTGLADRTRAMSFVEREAKPCDISMQDFDMLKVLGKGTFGKVMLVQHKTSKKVFAMKLLHKSMVLDKGELVHTLTENAVLAKCSHPFLTSLSYSFQTADRLCFVMEYVNGGEVFYHLRREKKFSEPRTQFYIAEISLAIKYLHENNIIYRDLKLENLLLDREGHIKITDFGLCKKDMPSGSATSTFCGTPDYLAPEVLEESEYGLAVDWWGVGAVMYEMLTGQLPFSGNDYDELFENILRKPLELPAVSPSAQDILSKLLDKDPRKRLGGGAGDGDDVLSHPFFSGLDLKGMYKKQVDPPFKPVVKDDLDVSNFDPYFTSEPVKLTPPTSGGPITEEVNEPFESFESVKKV